MKAMDLNEARIYVGTYTMYNNGSLQGEWVELSGFYDWDEFMERCAEIHEDEEEPEYMFQSWEKIPDCLIDEGHLDEKFFELRDELDRMNDTEKEAFWVWTEGNSIQLTQDAYNLVKSFQSDYIGSYASREDFAEEFVKMENNLSDFALSYFDFGKYADDLFDADFWYKDGYVFRNN
ncbi:antirestriction protein ArdA [Porphyromonas pogonae]|uniref:antirestriction protein ArdA n=1 Tax=Porphyromonas pogonae TaxID=867595 RepID=UPI002E7A77C2|nr:antirestriction protein ArdA [Porphyromonas pogonae]